MSALATYSFLPWLRHGIANTISGQDGTRALIKVAVRLSGDKVAGDGVLTQDINQDIALWGPGDIIGVDTRAILKTDPRPWITNYESNFLAAIEFYDEDFPWRYTPIAPFAGGLKLRPWLALAVLDETEFDEGKSVPGRPLPYISVHDFKTMPPADELWAWAHVHFNEPLSASDAELISPDMGAVLPRVAATIATNPDHAYSRLMCPRRLADNRGYHAFLVPAFETGRLAGLGLDPKGAPSATASAWAGGGQEANNIPYYYRWFFRTGSKGDFEYLVSLLKPQPANSRVGSRDMDMQDPGSNIPGLADPKLKGVLRLGGALEVPDADLTKAEKDLRQLYENWDQPYPDEFEKKLAAFINLPDDYAATTAAAANATTGIDGVATNPDPVITAPLYGQWHALTQRLLVDRDNVTPAPNNTNWVHRLNLDPRFRVAAGFGANVVETNAEQYMDYAWQQIGDVLAANQKIRGLHLATNVSGRYYDRHLSTLANVNIERTFAFTTPVALRVVASGSTIHYTQTQSLVPPVLTSTVMRRVTRPNGRLMRQLPFSATVTPNNLLDRVNSGAVSAAPPKVTPPSLPTVDQAGGAIAPSGAPAWILALLAAYPWLPFVLAILAVLTFLLLIFLLGPAGVSIAFAIGGALLALALLLQYWKNAAAPGQAISEGGQTPGAVAGLPNNPGFTVSPPGATTSTPPGSADSADAARFKIALLDWYTLLAADKAASYVPAPKPIDISGVTQSLVTGVDPRVTIPMRGRALIDLPPWISGLLVDNDNEVMAYPKIDLPMYEPLKKISIELFLPNINLVPPNSITLIETNQRFIESYMVGLNHEFARKLLWRGYPTDQRGSYFRQFWDVRSVLNNEGLSEDALKEKLYDIPPLHLWPKASNLGDHNNRASFGEKGEEAVLVIRGELLKKYPTAVIYAQHALWTKTDGGDIDLTQPRQLDQPTDAEAAAPPRSKIRMPLYEAKADPDIYFFGFDLTVPEAKGGDGKNPNDDAGWFFVIKERPGEPRFGLEIAREGPAAVFDHFTWDDALPGAAAGQFLPAGSLSNVTLAPLPPKSPELEQQKDDNKVNSAPASAARWAYVLFRAPVLVAVHADQMLLN
jgi:hypothetical protein